MAEYDAGTAAVGEPEGSPAPVSETPVGGDGTPAPSNEEAFYDANLVPEPLRPSYQKMQAAWTQKTQELAPWRSLEKYGKAEELSEFLETINSQEGLIRFWFDVADRLGVDQEQLVSLMTGEDLSDEDVEAGKEPDAPLTRAEFEQWQASQRLQAQQVEEDRVVDETIRSLGVKPEQERAVIAYAMQYPTRLGPAERIKRGFEDFKKYLDSELAAAGATRATATKNVPDPIGGSTAAPASEAPKTLDEARKRAAEYMSRGG